MTPIFRFTALLLIPLLVRLPGIAQNATGLQIRAIPESSDKNSLAVEVTDAQGAVPDAAVTFRLPEDGPGATFADGRRLAVVNTDHLGHASVSGIRWTGTGTVSVRITATKGTEHAGILIDRSSYAKASGGEPPHIAAKPAVPVHPTAPPLPKVAVTDQPPDPKALVVKAPEQKAIGQTVTAQNAASAVPPRPEAMPAIEPPHVSITSVSRNQASAAQGSSGSRNSDVEPGVSITGAGQRKHGGSKKWIILAAIAAGAGAGAAVMLSRGKSSSPAASTSTSGVMIGAPTISIGAP